VAALVSSQSQATTPDAPHVQVCYRFKQQCGLSVIVKGVYHLHPIPEQFDNQRDSERTARALLFPAHKHTVVVITCKAPGDVFASATEISNPATSTQTIGIPPSGQRPECA
jgi:hypothetical protein